MTAEWPVGGWLVRRRTAIQMACDGLIWYVALLGATLVRYDFNIKAPDYNALLVFGAVATIVQWGAGSVLHLYRGRYRFGSFEEVEAVLLSAMLTTWVIFLLDLPSDPRRLPISAPVAGGIFALVLMTGLRYAWRLMLERRARTQAVGAARTLIFGAGDGGAQAVAAMQADNFR